MTGLNIKSLHGSNVLLISSKYVFLGDSAVWSCSHLDLQFRVLLHYIIIEARTVFRRLRYNTDSEVRVDVLENINVFIHLVFPFSRIVKYMHVFIGLIVIVSYIEHLTKR